MEANFFSGKALRSRATPTRDTYSETGLDAKATGGQAWLTYHLSPDQQIQLQYRQAKAADDFLPGGTTQNDLSADVVLRPMRNLEIKANVQGELWKAPLLAQGQQHNVVGTIQLTYFLRGQ